MVLLLVYPPNPPTYAHTHTCPLSVTSLTHRDWCIKPQLHWFTQVPLVSLTFVFAMFVRRKRWLTWALDSWIKHVSPSLPVRFGGVTWDSEPTVTEGPPENTPIRLHQSSITCPDKAAFLQTVSKSERTSMWKFILLQLCVLGGLTLVFTPSFQVKEKTRQRQRKSDGWMNTGSLHPSHVDLIRSCLLCDGGADSSCQPWLPPAAVLFACQWHTPCWHTLVPLKMNLMLGAQV